MPINQLYRRVLTFEELNTIVKCFGLESVDDTRHFTKASMQSLDTARRMDDVKPLLQSLYIPCKYRLYVPFEFTLRECIVILRQLLRLHGYYIVYAQKHQRPTKGIEKVTMYCIKKYGAPLVHFTNTPTTVNMS